MAKLCCNPLQETKDDSVTYIEKVFSRASNCLVSTMPILSIIQKYRFF